MRDAGLEEAVRAVGGVSELARQIGISQPSVSNWNRVPAERVLLVEAATGVDRKILRPDLYAATGESRTSSTRSHLARAQEYALLATLLARAPDARLLNALASLRGDATPLGVAHVALAQAASETTVERVEREFFDLFIGLGRGEVDALRLVLSDRLPARAPAGAAARRSRPARHRARRGNYEPEDHAATLCEIMAGLVERPPAGAGRAPISGFSKSIWRPGSGASSPTWSAPMPPTSIAE